MRGEDDAQILSQQDKGFVGRWPSWGPRAIETAGCVGSDAAAEVQPHPAGAHTLARGYVCGAGILPKLAGMASGISEIGRAHV